MNLSAPCDYHFGNLTWSPHVKSQFAYEKVRMKLSWLIGRAVQKATPSSFGIESCPKSSHNSFYLNETFLKNYDVFKIASKRCQIFGPLLYDNLSPRPFQKNNLVTLAAPKGTFHRNHFSGRSYVIKVLLQRHTFLGR